MMTPASSDGAHGLVSGKRILVSGGAGVIGDALVRRIHAAGATVLVGDLKPRPHDWPADIRYRRGDLSFIDDWEIQSFQPEIFFHLAATFERSVETPEFWHENYHHNVRLSHHLMTALKACSSLQKVVFASSYLIYDSGLYTASEPAEVRSLSESDAIAPRNLCGGAKLLHEVELRVLSDFAATGFESVCARIFRSYGRGSRDIISRWVRALLAGEEIAVFASEGRFDYVAADDVAEGLIRMVAPGVHGVINLATGSARSVNEVLEVLERNFPDMSVRYEESDLEYEASQADMSRCQELLAWVPEHRLEETIPALIDFERSQGQEASSFVPITVLVTSVSSKIPLLGQVRDALAKIGPDCRVVGGDSDPSCLGRHFVDEFWQMPPQTEMTVEALVERCRELGISAIIPTRDGELAFFAEHRADLAAEGISVMVSSPETVAACHDKLRFSGDLLTAGFPAIPTSEALADVRATSFVVKERYGAASAGTALGVSSGRAQALAESLENPVFQPYVEGREFSVDVFMTRAGHAKGVIARTRDVVVRGESQITTTVRDPELETLCTEVARSLQCEGHVLLQAIRADTGLRLIECNPRIGGASSLALSAGLDSLRWFFLESLGESLDEHPFHRSQANLRQIRHAADLVTEV